jgi:hypothetical protein
LIVWPRCPASGRRRNHALLAEVVGDEMAAAGLFDGHAVADPKRSTLAVRPRLYYCGWA